MQQTSRLTANKHSPPLHKTWWGVFWWTSPPFQQAHVLSAGEARRGSALWRYWCECRWWPRLWTVIKHMAQSTATASENVCVSETKQRWPSGWSKANEMVLSAAEGTGEADASPNRQLQFIRWHFQSHWRGKKAGKKGRIHQNKTHSWEWICSLLADNVSNLKWPQKTSVIL